jgi:hypothetical protein
LPYVVNTELGAGTHRARGFKNLEPSEVADAIVDAVRHGTVEVWLPRSARRTYRLGVLLPRATSERLARAMKIDRVLLEADARARRGYEVRAAHSEPALDGADEPRQLTS